VSLDEPSLLVFVVLVPPLLLESRVRPLSAGCEGGVDDGAGVIVTAGVDVVGTGVDVVVPTGADG
jgi:hypothetical protein